MAVTRINGVAALTGFSHKKMYGRFVGTKKVAVIPSDRINKVTLRRGATVILFP